MSVIRVGLVGYGFAAKNFHIPFINEVPEYEIIAVLQRAAAPESGSAISTDSHCTIDLPGIRHYQEAGDFFTDTDIDLVVVATHIDTHALFAEKSLLAGKHGKVWM